VICPKPIFEMCGHVNWYTLILIGRRYDWLSNAFGEAGLLFAETGAKDTSGKCRRKETHRELRL
jgi:hypothetical protein